MLEYTEKASKLDLYARVKLLPVNEIQRAIAVNALRDADAISNGILWIIAAVRRLFTRTGVDASRLQHNH